ncbi:hypothetical protein QSI13_24755, partial [Escherichia coli]|uniref:hypothetical protein n=1 Tax=Escherichia coli TaxID=562 RepID=UPI00256E9B0E
SGVAGSKHPSVDFALVEPEPKIDNWTEYRPLHRTLPAPEKFPVEALGPELSVVVKRMSQVIQSPDAIGAF